ncbi:hypothetical protein SAMN05444161_1217 [Rhizobiales bacterium GAS191]|nr:hypothetical protein SAMN05444161_1217 [Rhizobiales bacterium GAS191]
MSENRPIEGTNWSLLDIEAKIREMEDGSPGLDVLHRALKLFEHVKLDLDIHLEGSPPRVLRTRNKAGTFHSVVFKDGLYIDDYSHGPDSGIQIFASLEALAWQVAELTIPRIYARAYNSAEREGTLLRAWNSETMVVSINAVGDEHSKEFENVDGVWRRRAEIAK